MRSSEMVRWVSISLCQRSSTSSSSGSAAFARRWAPSFGVGSLLALMLPYALSIVALVLVARKASYPQALMKPYRQGER